MTNEKYKNILNYTPSIYQEAIFDFVEHGIGNGAIRAYAGSGKTATMIAAMKLVDPLKKILFLAFNKAIETEIKFKVANYPNCEVKTLHSLGYSIINSNLRVKPQISSSKYSNYLKNELGGYIPQGLYGNSYKKYINNINNLLKFSRLNLCQSLNEIENIADIYGLMLIENEHEMVLKLMEYGKNDLSIIDYTDMVWLPNELDMDSKFYKYDWIFNDEVQDYSIAFVNLMKRCIKRGGRYIVCGDENQAINQFAGASSTAFLDLYNGPKTTQFELPISYRCDKSIIKLAQRFVPGIMTREEVGEGLIRRETLIKDIKPNDMVLCRLNSPLYMCYSRLMDLNIPCYIKGKEGELDELKKLIDTYKEGENLGLDWKENGLFPNLYKALIEERNSYIENGYDNIEAINSQSVQYLYDNIQSLIAIGRKCQTVSELKHRLENIFIEIENGVCLSTIHKAKGLEADTVHIICPSLMPMKNTVTPIEEQQEQNLIYVAYTRAKHTLNFVSEGDFNPVKSLNNDIVDTFDYIEDRVCKLFKISYKKPKNTIIQPKKKRGKKINPIIRSTTTNVKTAVDRKNKKSTKNKIMDFLNQ